MCVFAGLTVFVDKRITVRALKRQLEPFVGTNSDMFKVRTPSRAPDVIVHLSAGVGGGRRLIWLLLLLLLLLWWESHMYYIFIRGLCVSAAVRRSDVIC